MSKPDVAGVKEWVRKADGDLKSAEALIATPGVPAWSPAFHLQQCAEKYLKALLVALGIAFPKTHDGELIQLLPGDQRPSLAPGLVADLTEYAAAGRYPRRPEPTDEEVRRHIETVRALRTWVRQRLPAAAIQEP